MVDSGSALYQQLVLEHYRSPRNRGSLDACSHAADGANPLCGDRLRIEVRVAEGRIESLRFTGEACAIAIATTSMLGEIAPGRSCADLVTMAERFAQLIAGGDTDEALGDLNALRPLQHYPSRRKCALLPWATLRAALAGEAHTTTEAESA